MAQKSDLGAYSIMFLVTHKRSEVVALLLKYGAVVPSNATPTTIALMVTNLLKTSRQFNADWRAFMTNNAPSMFASADGKFANATGMFQADPSVFTLPSGGKLDSGSTSSSTPAPSSTSSGTPKWLQTGLDTLTQGLNAYLQIDNNKTKVALANASVQVAQTGGSIDPNTGLPVSNTPAPKSSNTTMYVVLGIIGIGVLGLVVYLANKKKA